MLLWSLRPFANLPVRIDPVPPRHDFPYERPRGAVSAVTTAKMSLSNLAHVCSHLNNASKARLAITSIPLTKLHYNLSLSLRDAGFISAAVPGGMKPPQTDQLLNLPTLTREELMKEPVTQANVASRRLWLGLKYWQSEPVIRKIQMISTPKRKLSLSIPELKKVIRGERSGVVEGIRSPGECIFLLTDQGLLEARDAVGKHIGGQALCRIE